MTGETYTSGVLNFPLGFPQMTLGTPVAPYQTFELSILVINFGFEILTVF